MCQNCVTLHASGQYISCHETSQCSSLRLVRSGDKAALSAAEKAEPQVNALNLGQDLACAAAGPVETFRVVPLILCRNRTFPDRSRGVLAGLYMECSAGSGSL